MIKKTLFLLLLILLQTSFASEELTTNSFKEIEKKALELSKKIKPSEILIALDIDNTLLSMPHDFGSDQWFNWQYKNCIGKKKLKSFCITKNMGKFLDLQGKIFAVANMIPSDSHVVTVVKNLQSKGFKIILLTSRGSEFRDSTQRAVKKIGLNFKKHTIGPNGGYPSTYHPYNIKKLKDYGVTKEEGVVAKLKKPRKVSFQNGIFMGAGQHKGIMLKTLLHKTKSKFKAIIFADDHEKHTKRMHQIYGKKKGINLVTYRYGAADKQVKNFKKSNKKKVIQDYKSFKQNS